MESFLFQGLFLGTGFQPCLVINIARFKWGKIWVILISFYLLDLLVVEYLLEININFYLSFMFICTLASLKKSSQKKIEKEIIEVFKHASDRKKKTERQKIGMMNFLTLTLYLSARLTLTLIFSFWYLFVVFKKFIFKRKI